MTDVNEMVSPFLNTLKIFGEGEWKEVKDCVTLKTKFYFYISINWFIFAASFRIVKYELQSAWKGVVNYFWDSKKYTYIVQEVFARTIMHNYCSAISQHIELPDHSRKLQYQINFSEAIKICRDDLRSRTKNNAIDIESLIANNIEAIRPNRTFRHQARFKLPMSFCYR